jgi:hypothetical protein
VSEQLAMHKTFGVFKPGDRVKVIDYPDKWEPLKVLNKVGTVVKRGMFYYEVSGLAYKMFHEKELALVSRKD